MFVNITHDTKAEHRRLLMAGLVFTPSAKTMFAFAILVLVLLFRPQGIMGKRTA